MASARLTFLGTGTSYGIPMVACDCTVCRSDHAKNKRLRTSALVENGDHVLILDTTPDFRLQCLRANVKRLDAIVYTHEHFDHLFGMDEARRFCILQKCRLPAYGSTEVMEYIQRIFPHAVTQPPRYKGLAEIDLHEVKGPFELGGWTLNPYAQSHGYSKVLGYRFDRDGKPVFAYLTDCKEVTKEVRAAFKGVPILILGALRHTPHPTHMTLAESVEVASEIGAGQTYFVHMAHDLEHEETNRSLPKGMQLAYDELVLELD